MVATLLKLRFRVLGNTLAANPWQLVGFILGGLWAVGLLIGVWIGLFAAGFAGLDVVAMVVTAGGGILVLGWALGPLFVAGVDTTLDPVKLAPFPLTTNKMMVARGVAKGSVSVIDFATRKVEQTWAIPGGGSPDMGNVSADGKWLWLSGRFDDVVYRFDTTTGDVKQIKVGQEPHGLTVWPQPGRYSLGHTGNLR